jgi:ribosome-associated toxin RatA of RatAB toxin-antitoxin module
MPRMAPHMVNAMQSKIRAVVLTTLALTAVVLAAGAMASEPDMAALERGEVLVKRESVAGTNAPRFQVHAIIDSPPAKVWEVVSNCDKLHQRLPGLRASRLVEREGNVHVCELTAALPFPMSDLTSVTRAEHTAGPKVWERKWKLLRGDYTRNEGFWRIEPYQGNPNRSLVVYQLHATTERSMPGWVATRIETKTMPEVIARVRAEAKKIK